MPTPVPDPNYIRIDPMPMIPFPSSPPTWKWVPATTTPQWDWTKPTGPLIVGSPTVTFELNGTFTTDSTGSYKAALPPLIYTYREV